MTVFAPDPGTVFRPFARFGLGAAFLATLLLAPALPAQQCTDNPIRPDDPNPYWNEQGGSTPVPPNCSPGYRCYQPRQPEGPYIDLRDPACNPSSGPCGVDLHVPFEAPGNSQNGDNRAAVYVFAGGEGTTQGCVPPSACNSEAFCGGDGGGGSITGDFFEIVIEGGDVTCDDTEGDKHHAWDFLAWACLRCCLQALEVPNVDFTPPAIAAALGCTRPKPGGCNEPGERCENCGAGGTDAGGGGPSWAGGSDGGTSQGPGARLRYNAGGVGQMGHPGSRKLNVELGRFWIQDYSERIVVDPTLSHPSLRHLWLLTRWGSFKEFFDDNGDGSYDRAVPADETRRLIYTGAGWTLREHDGMVHGFGTDGRWLSSTDRHGNAKTGTYTAGQLSRVDFPDGRHEDFGYHWTGRLASIAEVGIDGASRTWQYVWKGLDLFQIVGPDGLTLEHFYADSRHPGHLTRVEEVWGSTRRVLQAWEYDPARNVVRTWKGDLSFAGPNAVDKWSFAYDNPQRPTLTTATDPMGQDSLYQVDRDPASGKTRVTALSGSCSTCAAGPNSQRFFDDPLHPLSVTREIDGNGHETHFEYDALGQKIRQIEAVGEPEARVTEWERNPEYPALIEAVIGPYPLGGTPTRRLEMDYEPGSGNLMVRREIGLEEGLVGPPSVFTYETLYTYNPQGQPLTLDPPGFGTADVTSFTYDSARGSLIPLTRTDPLTGTTTFYYDGLNRQIGVRDPNGALTETVYDSRSRLLKQIQRASVVSQPGDPIQPGDLVMTYEYDTLRDLWRVTRPDGSWERLEYDPAGRLEKQTVTSVTFGHPERMLWTLDNAGHRTREELQVWNGIEFVTKKSTDFVYESRCHLAKVMQADGATAEYTYDCAGNLARQWDENHPSANQTAPASQTYVYDALNRLKSLSQPWAGAGGGNAVTEYSYDVSDHLASVKDAEGNVTGYTYSDRDLLTRETSPVSGETRHAYNPHGALETTRDARGIVTTRTLDAADRVTLVDVPGTALDTVHTYGNDPAAFNLGRLTKIARGSTIVDYGYDLFGRLKQDGPLSYVYDSGGLLNEIVYPGGVRVSYLYHLPGMPYSMTLKRDGLPDQELVVATTYLPFGPAESMNLGGGPIERHHFTNRYLPDAIKLWSSGFIQIRDWDYTTDAIGNVTRIERTLPTPLETKTYTYQDHSYFLTGSTGPWGNLAWSYDKIGNRLTESRNGVTDTYDYELNGNDGRTALLETVTGSGVTRSYDYGDAGHLEQVSVPGNLVTFDNDATGQVSRISRPAVGPFTNFSYDGRGFLAIAAGEQSPPPGATLAAPDEARTAPNTPTALIFSDNFETGDTCRWDLTFGNAPPTNHCPVPIPVETRAIYDSAGVLHHVTHDGSGEEIFYFHFNGRPIAQMRRSGEQDTLDYLIVDHLGTPLVLLRGQTNVIWEGGFEPFGKDFSGAQAAGLQLRFPGQWTDESWEESSLGAEVFYNVARWYEQQTGRYTRVDPAAGVIASPEPLLQPYPYADSAPTSFTDNLGLYTVDPSCEKWCGPPDIGQCSRDPAGQCIGPLIEDIWHRIVHSPPCRKALQDAGKWREARGAIHHGTDFPLVTCHPQDCTGPGSSGGRYFPVTQSIPLCSGYFTGSWTPGAQIFFHEILHGIGVHHGAREDGIMKACYPGFAP